MTDIPLGHADYHRSVAKEAQIQTLNRYYEFNPVLNDNQTALISRPALARGIAVGAGPIRATYTSPGSFDDALFVVSDLEWYRVGLDGTPQFLTDGINGGNGSISQAATGVIGTTPEYLFMADGRNLWLYIGNGYARGTISGSPAAGDVVRIGDVYYQFTTGSLTTGNGTSALPYLVKKSTSDTLTWQSFGYAINATGVPGTDYSTTLTSANPAAQTQAVGASSVTIRANTAGATGNAIITTETGAAIAWTSGTLTGGGQGSVTQVDTPENVGVVSVAYIASYVVVIPAQGAGINGRFWWIEPGETTIDPLNFATAERAPDPVYQVVVFGDQFWLPGQSTTEVWYFTGNIDSPVARLQGVTFDRGTWEGTAVQVKESMVIVDSDGAVFQIGGGLKRISNPAIEERVRGAIQFQASKE